MERTVSGLIDALGGNAVVGRLIGKAGSTVSEMKRSGVINVRYWPPIIAAARKQPDLAWVSPEALMMMHAPAAAAAPQPQEAAQ